MNKIRIGASNSFGKSVWLSEYSVNPHILEIGTSGSGKTYAMRIIENNIAEAGGSCCVLNYSGTHSQILNNDRTLSWDVHEKGIPFSLFRTLIRPDGSTEELDDVVEAIVGVFSTTVRLSIKQKNALRHMLYAMEDEKAFMMNGGNVNLKWTATKDLDIMGLMIREKQ